MVSVRRAWAEPLRWPLPSWFPCVGWSVPLNFFTRLGMYFNSRNPETRFTPWICGFDLAGLLVIALEEGALPVQYR